VDEPSTDYPNKFTSIPASFWYVLAPFITAAKRGIAQPVADPAGPQGEGIFGRKIRFGPARKKEKVSADEVCSCEKGFLNSQVGKAGHAPSDPPLHVRNRKAFPCNNIEILHIPGTCLSP